MSRYVSIWFPNLLTDWLAIRKPELKAEVFVLTTVERGRVMISASSIAAESKGIFAGMPLADAKAILPDIKVFDDQPGLAEKLLTKIGKWAIRYAPIVALDLPNGIMIDCSGCTHLWKGEEQYLEAILQKLKDNGFICRGGMADTIGAAWAVAHYGRYMHMVAENMQYDAILNLTPAALRIDGNTVQRLLKLGLDKIGKFIQMPRSVLRRRFGEDFLLKLGQALGTEEETLKPLVIIPPYEERLPCLDPISTRPAIEIAIEKLLKCLCLRLTKEGLGLRGATLVGYRIDGKVTSAKIGTNSPSDSVEHLCKLFALKIDQIEPALGIELFVLTATKVEPIDLQQEKLWQNKPGLEDQQLAQLLDRFAGKIGPQAIHRYLPAEHYWPERSFRPAISLAEEAEIAWQSANPRPISLLRRPEPVEVSAPIPDYPPMNFRYGDELHVVKKADGPERISGEWWLDKAEHRDYYIVEDEKGRRYWIFRSGHYDEITSRWFIHGFFA